MRFQFQREMDAKVVGVIHGLLEAPKAEVLAAASPETRHWKSYLEGYANGVDRRQRMFRAGHTRSQVTEFARQYIAAWTDQIVIPLRTVSPGWREAMHRVALGA